MEWVLNPVRKQLFTIVTFHATVAPMGMSCHTGHCGSQTSQLGKAVANFLSATYISSFRHCESWQQRDFLVNPHLISLSLWEQTMWGLQQWFLCSSSGAQPREGATACFCLSCLSVYLLSIIYNTHTYIHIYIYVIYLLLWWGVSSLMWPPTWCTCTWH